MTALKHDSQGFLVGELVSSQKEMLEYQQAGAASLTNIRTDVRAIARFLGARSSNSKPAEPAGRSGGATATRATRTGGAVNAQPRGSNGRFVSVARAVTPSRSRDEQTPRARAHAVVTAASAAAKAALAKRGNNGRFVKGGGGAGGNGGKGDPDSPGGLGAQIGQRLTGLKTALEGMTRGTEQVDPAVAAMHEVKDVVAPLGRGVFAIFGRSAEKKKERWYKRFLAAISGKKSEQPATQGAGGDSGMGIGAMAGGVARLLPLLLTGLGTILGGGLSLLLGTKIGGAIYDWLDKSGIVTKIFDAFDAAKDWIKEKVGKAKEFVNEVSTNYTTARDNARAGIGGGGVVLDASGRNINDPRRLDAAPTGAAGVLGRIVGGVHRGRDYMAGEGGRTAIENRALATGSKYSAGNIGGLSDAQTRALVASTVATESRGGLPGIVNGAGYMGRYQAGAGWLADAGMIKGGGDAVKNAMKADGFSREYDWGKAGGMTRFLKNDQNWTGGMSYQKYLADPSVQDQAFKTNSDKSYAEMLRKGMITPSTPGSEVAGLLKARHLAGMGGAAAVAAGGTGAADANGTTARKYFDDVARDRGGFLSAYSGSAVTAGALRPPGSAGVPSAVPDRLPVAETVTAPPSSGPEKDKAVRAVMREPIGQDVGDRNIAHIVSGGIGG